MVAQRSSLTACLGQSISVENWCPRLNFWKLRFYQEWLKPQDLFHRLSAVLIREEANLVYFSTLRGREDTLFGSDEIRLCRTLAPHLRSAVQMRRQLAMLQVERNAAVEVLDRLPTAVVLCDQSGTPIIVNGAAREILASNDGLVVRGGKLAARRQLETAVLENLIVGAASTARGQGADFRRHDVGLAGLRVATRCPCSSRRCGRRSAVPGHRRIAAALFISDPESVTLTNEERLLQLYGLTRAESRLAAKLAEGRSLEEAAAVLNIKTQTARSYIKRILCEDRDQAAGRAGPPPAPEPSSPELTKAVGRLRIDGAGSAGARSRAAAPG